MTGHERIAVLAPTARDGPLTIQILAQAGIEGVLAQDVNEVCRMLEEGAAAAVIAEEALSAGGARLLARELERQEPWSDLPLVIFGANAEPGGRRPSVESLAPYGNVVLLDRPVATITLLSSVRAALRARRRQYAARDVLENLAAAVRNRDQFLAVLGHELRNPLGAIMTASALLDLPQRDSAGPRAVIARQTRKLARLVDDLLEVSRITSGKISLQPVPVDVRDVVRRSVELVELSSDRAASRIRLSLPEAPVTVEGDPVRLEQIVGNLLSNAVKYTPAEGAISVEVETAAEMAVIRVRDSGVGIPAGFEERIFEPFSQVESARDRSEGGLGLGLSLVRGLVGLHGGTVEARSEGIDHGSEFVVHLPRLRRSSTSENRVATMLPPSTPCTVLVVDDQEDNRETMVMALEELGHVVRGAADGPSGVELALQMHPDAAIVDIGLPGFDGYEVARRIRAALGRSTRLFALTGYGQAVAVQKARQAGFDAHLTKPVELQALAQLLAPSKDGVVEDDRVSEHT
jgi:signal transduction histidine kinase/ActR/RegA family two-component response regulator